MTDQPLILPTGTERKIFDPRDPSTVSRGAELLDPTLAHRSNQWCLYLAGQAHGFGAPDLYQAQLAPGTPLSALEWQLSRDATGELLPVAGNAASSVWDAAGGRHCPAYVKGWDPRRNQWVERIYYAGSAANLWGPYAIGYLEWDGKQWVDQAEPAFSATEPWERGSVYEPNLLYHDGKWKMWYVAGSNQENYLVHGYAESEDGRTNWSPHRIFAPPELKMFDFCVQPHGNRFHAIFSRVWVGEGAPSPETGLWWCTANAPSPALSDWSTPVQIMNAQDRGWHSGPWKPSFHFPDPQSHRTLIFFDGACRTTAPGPFPFAFTLGCLEIDLPRSHAPGDEPADGT